MKDLNLLAKDIHQAMVDKGFYESPREIGTMLMLIVSELSEALEADRKDRYSDINGIVYQHEVQINGFEDAFKRRIKDTFQDEIADTVIRILDLVGYLEIDLEKHIEAKMAYNKLREHKHGKLY